MRIRRKALLARAAALIASLVSPMGQTAGYADWSSDDFGEIGLIQMPTARFAPDGEFRVGVSTAYPYNQILFALQWLPWLETGFRYSEVHNRRYGPAAFSGDQTYKDRSIDLKLRLHEESRLLPAFALGIRDIGGTGLFATEYLVASKEIASLDWTLGLAWGRAGARGGIRNPLAAASNDFEDRPRTDDRGDLGFDRLFSGHDIGLFGGLQWQTPVPNVSLKLEYDGNDYKSEALGNDRDVDSPVNFALNYRLAQTIDLSAGLERGNTFMARVVVYTNFARDRGPNKTLDPPATPVFAVEPEHANAVAQAPAADAAFFERVRTELERQQIHLLAMEPNVVRADLQVWFTQDLSRDEARAVGRIGQTLATMAPPHYTTFTVSHLVADAEGYRVVLNRQSLEKAIDFRARPGTIGDTLHTLPTRTDDYKTAPFQSPTSYPDFSWSTGPAVRQHIGGPDDFYFGQLWWRLGGSVALSPRWSFAGVLGADIYNNFDGLKQTSDSRLPKVRSDIVRYLKEGKNNLVRLETNYAWSPRPSWYARLSGGIFEEMYGGVAAELLYRRTGSRWAVGLDVNRVRQRDFDQRFSFRDYEVTTGHLTGYFDLPFWDMSARLSAGRYLAGDAGGTLELSRRFDSGIVAGIFATKTDVSSEDFGEGNFDKGIFVVLPFDLFFSKSTRRAVPIVFRPLTRDGGQKVRDGTSLFGLTESGRLDLDGDWSSALR